MGRQGEVICHVFNEEQIDVGLHHLAVAHVGKRGGRSGEASIVHLWPQRESQEGGRQNMGPALLRGGLAMLLGNIWCCLTASPESGPKGRLQTANTHSTNNLHSLTSIFALGKTSRSTRLAPENQSVTPRFEAPEGQGR